MSLDYIQVKGSRTTIGAPGTELPGNSAVTSITQGVSVGRGLDVTEAGSLAVRGFLTQPSAEPVSLGASLATIPTVSSYVRVANIAGSAMTNVILQAGTRDGQVLFVVNASAQALTPANPASTSNVADGNTTSIPANGALGYVWSSYNARWYKGA